MSDEQLTFETAAAARDEAIARADANAQDEWKVDAWNFLIDYLQSHRTMFVDDLWAAGLPPTREDRALGPLFVKAARMGLMMKTAEYRPSVRSHLTGKPVWRSLIFRENTGRLALGDAPVSDPFILNTPPL